MSDRERAGWAERVEVAAEGFCSNWLARNKTSGLADVTTALARVVDEVRPAASACAAKTSASVAKHG